MADLLPSISDIVEHQLPEYVRAPENKQFVSLLKHYYDWLLQKGQPTEFIHNMLQYRDIDLTNADFRKHLTASLLDAIPAYSKADRTLVTKHLTEFLKSKGTYESFYFIMNAIYGEDVQMEWNSDKLLRPSANEYGRTATLVIESSLPWVKTEGSELTQSYPSPASAIVKSCVSTTFNGVNLNWLELEDKTVVGTFIPGSRAELYHNDVNRSWFNQEIYYDPVSFTNHTLQFLATSEETQRPYNNLVIKQLGSTWRAVISAFISRSLETGRSRVTLTTMSETGTFIPGNKIYIFPSNIESTIYTEDSEEHGIVSNSVIDISITDMGSLYNPGDKIDFLTGSGELVAGMVSETLTGDIETIDIIKKGYGYSVGDKLVELEEDSSGSGAAAEVSAIDGIDGAISLVSELNTISIVNGGSGYAVNDEFDLIGGILLPGTPPARLRVFTVDATWAFLGAQITAAGIGYPAYTNIALINSGTLALIAGFAATPSFNSYGGITSLNITSYPTITTNALSIIADGYGAVAGTITFSTGAIATIPVTTQGINYIDPIVIVTGNGYGCIATANLTGTAVSSITIISGGAGYTTATAVIQERYGSGFAATPVIRDQTSSKGAVTAVTVLTRGQYTSLPDCFNSSTLNNVGTGSGVSVSFDFRLLSSAISNPGHYYQSVSSSVSGKGSGAVLVPHISNGVVVSLNKVSGGTGYTYAYVYIKSSNGLGAGFVAHCNIVTGAVDSIVIYNGGYNYSISDTVQIVGDGSGANYTILTGNLKPGVLDRVDVIDGGKNYFYGTTITCTSTSGISATLTPTIVEGVIKSIATNGGDSYSSSDIANITIGSGTTPALTTTISGNGGILGYNVIEPGSGYYSQSATTPEVLPLSITTGVAGIGAVLLPTLDGNGSFSTVTVLDGGSGYTTSSTIIVTNGGGTNAVLVPVVYNGKITSVNIQNKGGGYRYGTSALIIGDGINGAITPIVETGITSVEVITGGTLYASTSTVLVTDATGTGAIIKPTIVNGVVTALTIVNKGANYTNPTISMVTGGISAVLVATAKRNISSLNITNKGSGYTYADVLIVGDGDFAKFSLVFEKLGSLDTTSVSVVGSGLTATPVVTLTDTSNYGSVSRIKITGNGGGYKKTPIMQLPTKYDINNAVIATGTKFVTFGTGIGGASKVSFSNHGAGYNEPPIPVFKLVATLTTNASFRAGETVTLKNGLYRDITSTNHIQMENGNNIILENGDQLLLDTDISLLETGVTAIVDSIDYDRNIIHLGSVSDIFYMTSEVDESVITTEDELEIVSELSKTFEAGDIIVGSTSGVQSTIKYLNRANGTSVIGGNGWSDFFFKNEIGKLNNRGSLIADNQRYQDYAYVIKAGIAFSEYEDLLKNTVHPAGFSVFGDVVTHTEIGIDILNEIGYNVITSLIYLVSISADYQSNSEWTEMKYLFSDRVKFNFKNMPISLIKNYTILQTSDVLFKNYSYYYAPPIASIDLSTWSIINFGQYIANTGVAPSGGTTLSKITDTSTISISGFTKTVTSTIGDTITLEMLIKSQTLPTTFPRFELGTNYVNINTAGTLADATYSTNTVLDITQVGDYLFVRIKFVATSTSVLATLYPSYGFTSSFGISNVAAVGSIEVSDVVMKNITALTPSTQSLFALNSHYVADKFYVLEDEAQVTLY